MRSSYEVNQYGRIFERIIAAYTPRTCVELGVLHGYSTYHIARSLKFYGGLLDAYDLFEDYPYNHAGQEEVFERLADFQDTVMLIKEDAFAVSSRYANNSIDFLHVDLSNTGDIVRKVMEQWNHKITPGGVVIFEGGSEERDKVEWMAKYGKTPMRPELQANHIINKNYIWGVYEPYPSMTVMFKKFHG